MTMVASGQISLLDIKNEFGGSSPIMLNQYYRNAGLVSNISYNANVPTAGQIDLASFYGSKKQPPDVNYIVAQSAAACYSAQAGFSIDLYNGVTTLTMGVWPSDPPACQTCSCTWLMFNGTIASSSGNGYRKTMNIRPYWTQTWSISLDAIAVGNSVQTRAPAWPYTLVGYTYIIKKLAAKSIQVTPYPTVWSTGDNGTTASVGNWIKKVKEMGPITGYTPIVTDGYGQAIGGHDPIYGPVIISW